ncbi:SDR family NAD(P)-dependent oxidoreductase [Streptomyces sp. NPDC006879]|uniref:SDR family NAD(P)-dependent oxidoreductase n=1 Tax=Streptomyces sp. NPDC006879 TaxID=3364767 RepID=UPI0036A5ACC6
MIPARGRRRHRAVAVITGGSSGIGLAMATRLVGRGTTVVLVGRNLQRLETAAASIKDHARAPITTATADVADAEAIDRICQEAATEHGSLDLMFNNAGVPVTGSFQELTLDHWNQSIETNLKGVIHGIAAAYPLMLRQGSGHIVNISSLAGLIHPPLLAPYAAAKAAVVSLTFALRAEAAVNGVRATVACPGFVDTPFLDHTNPGLQETTFSANSRAEIRRYRTPTADADTIARRILHAVDHNRAVVTGSPSARAAWYLSRYAPQAAGLLRELRARAYHTSPSTTPPHETGNGRKD